MANWGVGNHIPSHHTTHTKDGSSKWAVVEREEFKMYDDEASVYRCHFPTNSILSVKARMALFFCYYFWRRGGVIFYFSLHLFLSL